MSYGAAYGYRGCDDGDDGDDGDDTRFANTALLKNELGSHSLIAKLERGDGSHTCD
jgi:hypothetical protein